MLTQAAGDCLSPAPAFAGEVAFHAICQKLGGYGHDVVHNEFDVTVACFDDASSQLNQRAWAVARLEQLLAAGRGDSFIVNRRAYVFSRSDAVN